MPDYDLIKDIAIYNKQKFGKFSPANVTCSALLDLFERAEAAEARATQLAEQVETLVALVKLKYGNLDPDVNKYLDEIGYGWPK